MNITNDNKYFIYARKSSEAEDRQVASIDAQIDELKKIAKEKNLKVVKVFTESQSAKSPGRPIFGDMLARITRGEANAILCWKLDRLTRNPVDQGSISWLLQSETIKQIQTYDRLYLPSDNVLIAGVEFAMANQYVRDLSTNVKRGVNKKLDSGWLPGTAPAGYLNKLDDHTIVIDPERYPLIKQCWELMLTGNYTVTDVLTKLNEEWNFTSIKRKRSGGTKMSLSGLYNIFTNIFYAGVLPTKGLNKPGKHVPMITLDEFDRVQNILGRKGKPRPQAHRFAFTGIMRCSCGSMITAEKKVKQQKNGNRHEYIYYRCTRSQNRLCQEKAVEVKQVHAQLDTLLEKLTVSERFQTWAIKYLHEIRETEAQSAYQAFENTEKAYANVIKQLDNLVLTYTSPDNANGELMTQEDLARAKAKLMTQKTTLETQRKLTGEEKNNWVELSIKTFNFARYARIWFANGDLEAKKAIFSCLGSDFVLKDQKVLITLREPFKKIFDNLEIAEAEIKANRTYESAAYKRENSALGAVVPIWQGV